jgi:hypothetical protein
MLEDKFKALPLSTKMLIINSMGNTFNRVFYNSLKGHELMSFYWYLSMRLLYIPLNRSWSRENKQELQNFEV